MDRSLRNCCRLIAFLAMAGALVSGPAFADPAGERVLRLERVAVEGNTRTPERIVTGNLGLVPGDPVTPESLDAARARLVATDYFRSVTLRDAAGNERGQVVVVVTVSERTNPTFETGYGFDDANGWFLTLLGLRFDNPFGMESRLRIGARLGFRMGGVDAEWTRPLSADHRFALDLRGYVYSNSHRFFGSGPDGVSQSDGEPATAWEGSGWEQFEQKIERAGGEAALRYELDDASFALGVSAERVAPETTFTQTETDTDFDGAALPGGLVATTDETAVTGVFIRMIRDTRDSPAHPTNGTFARLSLQTNTTLLGGDEIYTRGDVDASAHVHIGAGWVSSTRVTGGITSGGTPYFDRYYVGGAYSIRGFEEWSLSETTGDDAFWQITEEIRWPLVGSGRRGGPPRLTGLVFIDVGQGWLRGRLDADDIEAGAGYGLRLRLPWLGTIGFDVGVPISDGRTGDRFRAHGSIGFSF